MNTKNVYSEIYRELAGIEEVVQRLRTRAEQMGDAATLIRARNVMERCKAVRKALLDQQVERTEEQLNASLELIGRSPEGMRRRGE